MASILDDLAKELSRSTFRRAAGEPPCVENTEPALVVNELDRVPTDRQNCEYYDLAGNEDTSTSGGFDGHAKTDIDEQSSSSFGAAPGRSSTVSAVLPAGAVDCAALGMPAAAPEMLSTGHVGCHGSVASFRVSPGDPVMVHDGLYPTRYVGELHPGSVVHGSVDGRALLLSTGGCVKLKYLESLAAPG